MTHESDQSGKEMGNWRPDPDAKQKLLDKIFGKKKRTTQETNEKSREVVDALIEKIAQGMAQQKWPSFEGLEPSPEAIAKTRRIVRKVQDRRGGPKVPRSKLT